MKWIKSRKQFINEAKLRQVLHPRQTQEVASVWGEKYLDYEEVKPTEKIKQGKWKLSEEDKLKALSVFFQTDMNSVLSAFSSLNDKFCHILTQSISVDITNNPEKYSVVLKEFNPKEPSIDQIVAVFDSVFRKLNTSETMADTMIQKDENGRPVRDENGEMIKISKEKGSPIFTNNLINLRQFMDDFNRCFPESKVQFTSKQDNDISSLRNIAKEDCNGKLKVDFEIFNRDLYLSISHNPKDILNMSISKFYNSCQNLYDGGYRTQVLGNVFDPNSIPAFLTFETPIYWRDEKVSDQLPLARTIIRSIESFTEGGEDKIFFDRAYPDRIDSTMYEIIEKYSGNKKNVSDRDGVKYIFSPDIQTDDVEVKDPYMDRLQISRQPMIGVNTKSVYLSRVGDWSKIKISPDAKIKELVIETIHLPENLLKLKMELDWIKFKYLKLVDLSVFDSLITDSLAFDKCKFDSDILSSRKDSLRKLQIISCDTNDIDLSQFSKLEELHLIYTANDMSELKRSLVNTNIKKLVISGDLITSKEDREFINSIKNSGVKVEIKGPVL